MKEGAPAAFGHSMCSQDRHAVRKDTQECAKGWADDGALRVGWGEGTAGAASSGRERCGQKRTHLTRCKGAGPGTGRDSRGQRPRRQNCSLGGGRLDQPEERCPIS